MTQHQKLRPDGATNGQLVKREDHGLVSRWLHDELKQGDEVRLRLGAYEHILIVRELSERRGPASVAQTLYEETQASRDERARLAAQLKMAPPTFVYEEKGRPTKKDRRDLSNFIDRKRR